MVINHLLTGMILQVVKFHRKLQTHHPPNSRPARMLWPGMDFPRLKTPEPNVLK